MKDTELHVGLELADLRDGISRNLGISQHNYKTKQEYSFPFAGTVFDKCLHRIEAAKLEIEFQKRET